MPYRRMVKAAARATGRLGWLRGAFGALAGLALAATVTGLVLHATNGFDTAGFPLLLAPLGASAVLVFAFPASPLAQPWPMMGGNMISAGIGLLMGHLLPATPLVAAPLAVCLAIAAMSLCRCLHPPGGACALLAALGTPAIATHGPFAMLWPLAINVTGLFVAGWAYNGLTGHRWPHHPAHPAPLSPEGPGGSYEEADLDAVLEEWDEVLDVSREDLDALFRALERRVQQRWQEKRPR